jgi:hypothetical protein
VLREVVLRLAVVRGFAAVLRDVFAAPVPARFAVERFAGDLRAAVDRLAPAPADFAAVERVAVDLRAVDFRAVDLRAPVERFAAEPPLDPDEAEAEPSIDHLPDITRCAASATASAISEPSLVALETTLLAAVDAVSAASRPASRIFLRAAGLAAIAAAAAVNPAASISLLIAALASLSTVLSFERERELEEDALEPDLEEVEREELFRGDFAIFSLPASPGKTLYSRFGSRMKCEVRAGPPENVKGTAAYRSDALRHGQRPEMWPSVSDQSVRTPLSDLPAEP